MGQISIARGVVAVDPTSGPGLPIYSDVTTPQVLYSGVGGLISGSASFDWLSSANALRLGTGAVFDLYNTADKTTNYERLRAEYIGSVATISTQFGGSAAARSLRLGVNVSPGTSSSNGAQILLANAAPFITFNTANTSSVGASFLNIAPGQHTASSGTQTTFSVAPTINQAGTAGYTALDVNVTETATGSGTKLLQRWAVGGTAVGQFYNTGLFYGTNVVASGYLGLGASLGATPDVLLRRDSANSLSLLNGANAQTFRVYNTYTDASNYRRWNLSWNTTTAIMQVVGAGTGTNGNLAVGNAALATGATVGYFMIPSSAGAPTGVPADIPTGQVALHFDSTNNKLYVYDGGWLSTAALT